MKKITLSNLENTLKSCWCRETCYKPDENKWSKENPAFGQCAVTSLVVQDFFGGELCYCEHQKHYWNKLDSKEIDFTISRFPKGTKICCDKIRTRNYVLFNKDAIKASTYERYLLLKNCVERTFEELSGRL